MTDPKTQDPTRDKRKRLLGPKVTDETNAITYGYAKNISKSGMFIVTMRPKKIGEEFGISFELPNYNQVVSCRCKVVRLNQSVSNPVSGMGVMFLDLHHNLQKKLEEWVEKKLGG